MSAQYPRRLLRNRAAKQSKEGKKPPPAPAPSKKAKSSKKD
jgi:hypothetical protein